MVFEMLLNRLSLLFLVTFITILSSQVPVYEEPYHHLVFENEMVRILDVQLQPGDTSAFHLHADPISYVTINGSHVWLDPQIGESPPGRSRTVFLKDNYIGSDISYRDSPFVHRIANVDMDNFRLIAVENLFTSHRPDSNISIPGDKGEVILHNDCFLIIKIEIDAGKELQWDNKAPAVIILKSKTPVTVHTEKDTELEEPGDWVWFDGEKSVTISNTGKGSPGEGKAFLVFVFPSGKQN